LELIFLDSLTLIIFLDLAEITFSDKLDLGVQDDEGTDSFNDLDCGSRVSHITS